MYLRWRLLKLPLIREDSLGSPASQVADFDDTSGSDFHELEQYPTILGMDHFPYVWRAHLPVPLLVVFLTCSPAAQEQHLAETVECQVGETLIRVLSQEWPGSALSFINLHDDENTSVDAATEVLSRRGGRLLQLSHAGTRRIKFVDAGVECQFDPNRMFTDEGAAKTLAAEGCSSETALERVRRFALDLLALYRFDELALVVTLHNNGEDGYSLKSYVDGGIYEDDAARVHYEPGTDPDDFLFVTDLRLFETMSDQGLNVVLQDNDRVTDDGSLSVLAGRVGIPYVNVEAQEGHLREQIAMIEAVYAAAAAITAAAR